jgi:hypothetical protein
LAGADAGRHAVFVQEHHHLTKPLLRRIRLDDLLLPLPPDAVHLTQPFGRLPDDGQRLVAEARDEPLRQLRPDAGHRQEFLPQT